MKKKTIHEMETVSIALQVFLCITMILTIINEVISINNLIQAVGKQAVSEVQVILNLFYLAIQIFALCIFRAIAKNKTPFIPVVSRNIKIIGGLIMFFNAVAQWTAGMILMIMNDGGTTTMLDNAILIGFLLGLIFACLGSIFDYGCVLQQQDDETL